MELPLDGQYWSHLERERSSNRVSMTMVSEFSSHIILQKSKEESSQASGLFC